jgi:CYTH domain-containing protein
MLAPEVLAAHGFPKPAYTVVERERRWLCHSIPLDRVASVEHITDLYVTGTRLRLRDARPEDGGPPRMRFSRKADVNASTRLITSIYLPENELAVLAASLPGTRLRKRRHRLAPVSGVAVSIDAFDGALEGLLLAEAEFESDAALAAFPTPDFAIREVTDDPRYTGGQLVLRGLPR